MSLLDVTRMVTGHGNMLLCEKELFLKCGAGEVLIDAVAGTVLLITKSGAHFRADSSGEVTTHALSGHESDMLSRGRAVKGQS